jgi:hypothetical protein
MKAAQVGNVALAALTLALLLNGAAQATAVAPGSAPAAPRGLSHDRRQAAAAASAAASTALTLIEGQVSSLNRAKGTATIAGREVSLHGGRLQVFFARGGRASLADLRPGSRVRFALEPGSGEGRKIVLIYIEGAA